MHPRSSYHLPPKLIPGILLVFLAIYTCERFEPERLLLVQTDTLTGITTESSTVKGVILFVGEGEIDQHGFCWSEAPEPTVSLDTKVQLGTRNTPGSFQWDLNGLEHNTTYYIRAYASDGDGTVYGKSKTFTTQTIMAPEVHTSDIRDITNESAKSGGEVTFDGGSPITARGLCWSTSQNPDLSDMHTDEGEGMGEFQSEMTGLSCNTKYYVRAYAKNSREISYGQQEEFETGICLFRPTVTTATVTDITDINASSGGEVTDDGHSSILARGVCWSTSPAPTIEDNKTMDGAELGPFESQVTGLSPDMTYYLRAYATNSEGTEYGQERSFKTWEGSVTDIDGNVYQTVQIGDQVWMKENLRVTHYPDGSPIHLGSDSANWSSTEAAYCWYNNDDNNLETFGALYDWYAAMNGETDSDENPSGVQGVCPDNWHLPSDAEWKELEIYAGMSLLEVEEVSLRGVDEGLKLKEVGTEHWSTNPGATDELGFTALPGGFRVGGGDFRDLRTGANFWTSSMSESNDPWFRYLGAEKSRIGRWDVITEAYGLSVRCLKD